MSPTARACMISVAACDPLLAAGYIRGMNKQYGSFFDLAWKKLIAVAVSISRGKVSPANLCVFYTG